MKYAYLSLFALGSIVACAVPTSPVEEEGTLQAASTSCAAVYGQCGGQGWTGPTCCVSSTCQYQNAYYSQCLASSGSSSGSSSGGSSGQCPQVTTQDSQLRSAATVAFDLMRLVAAAYPNDSSADYVYSVLASQRYRVQSSGTAIEFDPTDPYYSYVTNPMKAALAFAQLDSGTAQFLVGGLNYAYSNTDGKAWPSIPAIQALAGYKYPGPTTAAVLDHTSNSDMATITGKAWCSTSIVTIAETCVNSNDFSPMISRPITRWRSGPPAAFHGTSSTPSSPFNGASASGNPYLVVSVNGQTTSWADYNFAGTDCTKLPNATCTASLQVDPVPYAEPGAYYDTSGNLVGTQANPFAIVGNLYAVIDHESQWATRTVNGVQEWGTFSTPVTLFGITQYKYVKQM
jgi:hypothetical protein